jgi:hypothetical protein
LHYKLDKRRIFRYSIFPMAEKKIIVGSPDDKTLKMWPKEQSTVLLDNPGQIIPLFRGAWGERINTIFNINTSLFVLPGQWATLKESFPKTVEEIERGLPEIVTKHSGFAVDSGFLTRILYQANENLPTQVFGDAFVTACIDSMKQQKISNKNNQSPINILGEVLLDYAQKITEQPLDNETITDYKRQAFEYFFEANVLATGNFLIEKLKGKNSKELEALCLTYPEYTNRLEINPKLQNLMDAYQLTPINDDKDTSPLEANLHILALYNKIFEQLVIKDIYPNK